MSTARIYYVANAKTGAQSLVRANSQAQAIRHVVADDYRAVVAGQETIIELLQTGHQVMDATREPTTEAQED